jgi:hypothetical protein
MKEIDLIFQVNTLSSADPYFCTSDGGKTWRTSWLWHEFDRLIEIQVGRFIVDEILKPRLNQGEELCDVCRDKGKIGIIRFHHDDVTCGVRYQIYLCERCGHEERDYG